jgi:hypothetical protein
MDSAKRIAKWQPLLEQFGVKDREKMEWMSEMAEIQNTISAGRINENAYNTLHNGYGMGAVVGAQPSTIPGALNGTAWANNGGTLGSGDIAQSLTPVSLKIAAQTVGLELLPTLPANSPYVQAVYVDFPYEDGRLEGGDFEKPTLLKLTWDEMAEVSAALMTAFNANSITVSNGALSARVWMNITTGALIFGSEPATKTNIVELLGFSFIDGQMIVRVYKQSNIANSGAWTFDATRNTFGAADVKSQITTTAVAGEAVTLASLGVQLVSTLEDHVPGYSSNFVGRNGFDSMNRAENETNYPNTIGIQMFSKAISIGEDKVSTWVTQNELEDIPAATGLNVMNKMESILANELTQKISRKIVAEIRRMGELNRATAPVDGAATPHASFGGFQTIFDVNTDYSMTLGGETTLHVQRKLATAINNASMYLLTKGRVNKAAFLITNYMLASALTQLKGFYGNDIDVTVNNGKQIAPYGSINGIKIYVDPYQEIWDNSITLGCKNKNDEPGLVFVPYLMAQKVELMSEANFTPRIQLRSRYAIADLGFFPYKQYITIRVADDAGLLR